MDPDIGVFSPESSSAWFINLLFQLSFNKSKDMLSEKKKSLKIPILLKRFMVIMPVSSQAFPFNIHYAVYI